MKSETKRYKVVILDKEYNIVSDEPEEHVMAAATLVDETMRGLIAESQRVDQQQLAVLSSLQIASKLLNTEQKLTVRQKREDALIEWTEDALSTL
ncbi:cell division protein ZapA [Candidatus Dependentiae bacterium]|nr:MAG: cell division protein ZapA [Candidatus Dependentiae bacterium]